MRADEDIRPYEEHIPRADEDIRPYKGLRPQ